MISITNKIYEYKRQVWNVVSRSIDGFSVKSTCMSHNTWNLHCCTFHHLPWVLEIHIWNIKSHCQYLRNAHYTCCHSNPVRLWELILFFKLWLPNRWEELGMSTVWLCIYYQHQLLCRTTTTRPVDDVEVLTRGLQ